jgi:hypothetical protein
MFGRCFLFVGLLIGTHDAAQAQGGAQIQEDYAAWELLKPEFGSTGGGGVIIRGYAPVVSGSVCTTDFTATEANGTVYENSIEFEALPIQGGILCHAGKWRAKDGSATGTTPFRVFIKDGVSRRSP